jgi:pimeloyl-ACP methyl ester carboxylesterase
MTVTTDLSGSGYRMTDVDGTNIRTYIDGVPPDGPRPGRTVVYLHSASGEVCPLPFFERLVEAGYHVVAPELPGCGGSAEPTPPWRSLEDAVFHVRRTVDLLTRGPAIVIGSSLGGWLAAELAVWCPALVERLVLINAVGLRVEGAPIFNIFGVPGDPGHQSEVMQRANPHSADTLSMLLPAMVDTELDPATMFMMHFVRGATAAARIGWNPYLHDPRLPLRLGQITAPTLVVWGADDGIVPLAHGEAYTAGIPGARLDVMSGTGHLPVLEQPASTADRVIAFLEEGS